MRGRDLLSKCLIHALGLVQQNFPSDHMVGLTILQTRWWRVKWLCKGSSIQNAKDWFSRSNREEKWEKRGRLKGERKGKKNYFLPKLNPRLDDWLKLLIQYITKTVVIQQVLSSWYFKYFYLWNPSYIFLI